MNMLWTYNFCPFKREHVWKYLETSRNGRKNRMMALELLFAHRFREERAQAMEHDLQQQPPRKRNLVQTISDPEEPFRHPPVLRLGDYFFNQKFLILVKPGNSVTQ